MAFDPAVEWTVDRAAGASKSRNTPFHGMTLKGRVACTVVAGQVVYDHGRFAETPPLAGEAAGAGAGGR